MRSLVVVAAVAVLALPWGLAPPAAAHCEPEDQNTLKLGLSTCPANPAVEDALETADDASGREHVLVLLKDQRFHPEVARVASGGVLTFVWADSEGGYSHDPMSSGSCGTVAADLSRCAPRAHSRCFDIYLDMRASLREEGDTYSVRFAADAATGSVLVSHVPEPGDVQGIEAPQRLCPAGSASVAPDTGETVVPYHCGNHGGLLTAEKDMRGAIVVLP